MAEQFVRVETIGGTRVITIDRAERKNALGGAVSEQILAGLTDADGDEAVRSVVITGANGLFSAGADIKEFPPGGARMAKHIEESIGFLTSPERVHKPVIAAVDGIAFGGGFELAMCCDAIVASEAARFGLPEPRLGLTPGVALQRLPYLVGVARARQVLLFGDQLGAEAAHAAGLVREVVPSVRLLDAALALGAQVEAFAPLALEVEKASINRVFSTGDLMLSLRSNAFLSGTEDSAEGRTAFAERRPPVFRGA